MPIAAGCMLDLRYHRCLESAVLQWVATYGYFAIFGLLVFGIVGIPVPDEFLLTGCGFLIYRGDLHAIPAFASALGGSMCGITCSYIIGRTLGWKFLHSRAGRCCIFATSRSGGCTTGLTGSAIGR